VANVSRERVIQAAAAAVWATIADFAAVEQYSPMVSRCDLEGPDGPGQLRHLTLSDGTVTTSRLVEIQHEARVLAYEIVVTQLPLTDYASTMRVEPVSSGRCRVTWSSRFAPRGASLEEASAFLVQNLDAGLEALANLHEVRSAAPR
jgi:mxaD protein